MRAPDVDREQYAERWTDLNRRLRHIERHDGGLGAALEALKTHQLEQGFIKDDLHLMRRYRYAHPRDPSRFFLVQFNPVRALRFQGSGRKTPPVGVAVPYDGCFLCPENVLWQQAGAEMGYEIDVDSARYIAWMNAYPLMPVHCVVATADHIPQAWCRNGEMIGCMSIDKILDDLVDLSRRLPGYVGFYNGQGAGASIPGHFHFQFFKRPQAGILFPLEITARESGIESHGTIDDYPLAVEYWRGDPGSVTGAACAWIRDWLGRNRHQHPLISANIVATFDDIENTSCLFFVPRHQQRMQSPEMSGTIGGVEILGELVFSSDEEGRRLERGDVDYHTIERILSAVRFGS